MNRIVHLQEMQYTAYIADRVFNGDTILEQQAVVVREGIIQSVEPAAALPPGTNLKVYGGCLLAPAFIDIQIYGAHQKLLAVHPEPATLQRMYEYCRAGGAPLFVPTVATNAPEVMKRSIDAVKAYWQQGGRGVLGLHLEGPWISREKRGVHLEAYIHAPAPEEVRDLLEYGKGVIKIITLAPEVCSREVIHLIRSHNIIISAGHSNATYAEATAAFDDGISTATHLYNAMSALQHRAPGMVGALFNHPAARCSIIPDGFHVDYAAVAIAKKMMGERLFVITDAVTETDEGPYRHQPDGERYVCDGTLSGSALTMVKAFRNLVQHAGIETGEALRMCSLYPARVLGADGLYGKIAPGYAAQFVVLNRELEAAAVLSEQQAW